AQLDRHLAGQQPFATQSLCDVQSLGPHPPPDLSPVDRVPTERVLGRDALVRVLANEARLVFATTRVIKVAAIRGAELVNKPLQRTFRQLADRRYFESAQPRFRLRSNADKRTDGQRRQERCL